MLFDGQTSEPEEVTLHFDTLGGLNIRPSEGVSRRLARAQFNFQLPVGHSAIKIKTNRGELIEIPHNPELVAILINLSNGPERLVRRAEVSIWLGLSVSLLALLLCIAFYRHGLPEIAGIIQPIVPSYVKDKIGQQVIYALDLLMFEPSKLPQAKQHSVAKLAQRLSDKAGMPYQVEVQSRIWKEDEKGVPNALAILPRTIIVTDRIVEMLTEQELEGVIAHEIGHLAYDHGTLMLIRGSLMSVVTLVLFGPDPGIVQSVAVGLVESRYSQEQESAADAYAAELLRKIGKNPTALAEALEKISQGQEESEFDRFLSSHPLTADRVRALRAEGK